MGLLDLIRRPKARRAADAEKRFVAVIFANGEDDDLPGLIAAAKNEPVQLDEKIYKPGETIRIVARKMLFNCGQIVIHQSSGELRMPPKPYAGRIVEITSADGRDIYMRNNDLFFNGDKPGRA